MYKNTLKIILLVAFIISINGCSCRDTVETVTFREYKKIEQLRGQPPKIYVRASDSYVYIFSHSNYYIQNDTLFGKDNSGIEIVLTNIKSITYNNYDIEQDLEVYYDAEKDSIVGYKYAGAKAYVEMNDGSDYTGELLTVRDSIMIVCEEYDADEQELADSVYALFVLNNRDIKLIELSVGNYLGAGMVVGYTAGAAVGGAAGSDPNPYYLDLGAFAGALAGGLVGAIIGGTIGFIFTDYEDVYEQANPEEYDFKKLNIYARYVNNEPEYLKKIK
jgi:hypothetical protein